MLAELEKYQLKLPSILENIARVEALVDSLRDEYRLDDGTYANMLIALTEAVNNAIMHGNRSDPGKIVDVSVQHDDKHLCFVVKDEGPGFDYQHIPDPTAPENLEKPAGRGIFLMTQLSDLVVFSDNGTTVEVQFKL